MVVVLVLIEVELDELVVLVDEILVDIIEVVVKLLSSFFGAINLW